MAAEEAAIAPNAASTDGGKLAEAPIGGGN